MHTVILRDDDTNALTPPECLERLYRPFLDRGMPVNLAVIPEVRTDVRMPDGTLEGFLPRGEPGAGRTVPIAEGRAIVEYLKANPGFRIVQHGCHHDYFEFDVKARAEVAMRLDRGARRLAEAGFAPPRAFVAPYDKFSPAGLRETARRFPVISTGWFEWRRIPAAWLPGYAVHKASGGGHWRRGGNLLLRHPGCILSCHHPKEGMLERVQAAVLSAPMTVLVTHWWEYFRGGKADEPFISVLHSVAGWLASRSDVRVVAFDDLAPPGAN